MTFVLAGVALVALAVVVLAVAAGRTRVVLVGLGWALVLVGVWLLGRGGGERSEVVVDVKTAGGATFVANLDATGADSIYKGPRGADLHATMDASKDPSLAFTITQVGSTGTLHVLVHVDGKLVARTHTTPSDGRISIVGEPDALTVASRGGAR